MISAGKESAYNAGDPSSIPGSENSPAERIGSPLQYSWASLVVQTVKNPPEIQEIWIGSMGWEDPLEEGMATHSRVLAWRIPMDRGAGMLQSMGLQRVRHDWAMKYNTVSHLGGKQQEKTIDTCGRLRYSVDCPYEACNSASTFSTSQVLGKGGYQWLWDA